MSHEQAVRLALTSAAPPQPAAPAAGRAPTTDPSAPLTAREQEVATLVARGLSNRQIADELVIAQGTASIHVHHILAKLELASRAQLAVWAVEHGLLRR